MPSVKISKLEWAYIAGLIDGEGWIGVTKLNDKRRISKCFSYHPHIAVSMTNKRTVRFLYEKLGGYFEPRTPKNIKWKKQYRWNVDCNLDRIKYICEHILPYSITKKNQIERMIEYCNLRLVAKRAYRTQRTYTNKEHALFSAFKNLNS